MKKFYLLLISLIVLTSCSTTGSIIKTEEPKEVEITKTYSNYNKRVTDKYLKALNYKELGQYYAAIVEFQNAYNINKDAYIQKEIANCYLMVKQYENALKAVDIALDDFEEEDIYVLKLKILQQLKKTEDIVDVLKKLVDIVPSNKMYYLAIAELEFNMSNYSEVKSILEKALEYGFDRETEKEIALKGGAYASVSKNNDDAIYFYKTYLNKYGNDIDVLNSLNRLYLVNSEFKKALKVHEEIVKIDSMNPQTYNIYFILLERNGENEKAGVVLEEAYNKFKGNREITYNFARYNASNNRALEAGKLFRELIQNDSTDIFLFNEMGIMYDEAGEKEEAEKTYKEAIKRFPDNSNLLNNYAYLLSELNRDLDTAVANSKRAVDMEPENSSFLDTYGWVLYRHGDYEEALKFIQKAIERKTGHVGDYIMYEHKGDIYLKLNDKDNALKSYEEAFKMSNDKRIKEKIESIRK